MNPFVLLHVVSQPKSFSAEGTFVVFLSRVRDSVAPQFLGLLEAFAAELALVRPLIGVVHHVHLELLPGGALQAADGALHVLGFLFGAELQKKS